MSAVLLLTTLLGAVGTRRRPPWGLLGGGPRSGAPGAAALCRIASRQPGTCSLRDTNVCSYSEWMVFLARRDCTAASAAWWHEVRRYDKAAPSIIRELLRGPSVVADAIEVQQAVAWVRAHPSWRDDDPPLLAQDKATVGGA
jgi:hypothetical protein